MANLFNFVTDDEGDGNELVASSFANILNFIHSFVFKAILGIGVLAIIATWFSAFSEENSDKVLYTVGILVGMGLAILIYVIVFGFLATIVSINNRLIEIRDKLN